MSNLLRITNKIEALGIWDSIPSDSINSVVIEFEFAEDWKNLLCVAQFTQGEKTYNVVIENNRCVLPTELKIGNVMLSVFGTKTDGTPFRETSIPFCFEIYDAGFSSTAETPIPPTPDLYEQLIDKFAHSSGVAALNGKTGDVDIVADEGISVDDTETGKIKIKSTAKVTVDTEMSNTSENPVQNKVVKKYADDKIKYRIINDITITEDISVFSTSQDDNGNAFDLQKFFFLFIGKFDAALSNKILSLSVKNGYQFLMHREFTGDANKELGFWLSADNFLRTNSLVGIQSEYSNAFLLNFRGGMSKGLSGNNQAVNSDVSLASVTSTRPVAINEIRFGVHDKTIKMKKGSRFLLLGIDYNN